MMDALSGHHYDLVSSLLLPMHGYLFSGVDVHCDRLLTQLLGLGLQRVLVILLVSLIDPKYGKTASSVDSQHVIGVACQELDDIFAEVANWAHLIVPLALLAAHQTWNTLAAQVGIFPHFVLVSLEQGKLLGKEAPQVIILRDPLAVPAGLVEMDHVVRWQKLQRLLQWESHHFVQQRGIRRPIGHEVCLHVLGLDHFDLAFG